MTRDEHMIWCKRRALGYAVRNDLTDALNSMMSDLTKHSETENHSGITLTLLSMLSGHLKSREEVIKHIEGFN